LSKNKVGLLLGLSAYILWGIFPLYWPLLKSASAAEIVSHRAIWTLVFCTLILAITKSLKNTVATLRKPKIVIRLCLASALVSVNWLVYIWATNNGHVVEASLGYYINPLAMVAFGVFILKEKLRKLQWIALGTASFGVLVLTIDYGRLPWIALTLATSWGSYGLIKKRLGLKALDGLAIETLLASLPYLIYLIYIGQKGNGHFGHGAGITFLLISAGAVTAIPLLLFNGAMTRLPLTVIGLMQYITPTITFSIGVWVRHEDMPTTRWVGFLIIWLALVTLAADLVKSSRAIDNRVA
jgi:chloramphenicol-sensitive protein RarD